MNYRLWLLLLLALPGWALAASCTVLIVGDSLSSGYGLAQGQGWVDLARCASEAIRAAEK
jgi:acyl-CoA thioesterase I